jgi:protein ImuA
MHAPVRQAPASASATPALPPLSPPQARNPDLPTLPGSLGALWRGSELARSTSPCHSSGFTALDAELPGGGWPTQQLSEILLARPGACEWRLLGPALRGLLVGSPAAAPQARPGKRGRSGPAASPAARRPLLLINPPLPPHLPGLAGHGISAAQLVWIAPGNAAHALWAAEQAIKADAAAAVLAWLPEARPEQIRRLQAAALGARAPVFVLRPAAIAQPQSSAAPLRLLLEPGPDWTLRVRLLKRRGPMHEGWLTLPSLPAGLGRILAPRLLQPAIPPLATGPRPNEPAPELPHEQAALARAAA